MGPSVVRPRIGDTILVSKGAGNAMAVMSAKDVLSGLDDEAAYLFGEQQKSLLGIKWLTLFYRVAVELEPGKMQWFDSNKVKSVTRRTW